MKTHCVSLKGASSAKMANGRLVMTKFLIDKS